MADDWAEDIDYDRQNEVYQELGKIVQGYVDGGMHPEQIGMLLHFLTSTYKGRAENETWQSGEYRLQHRLWEVVRDVEDSDDYDLDWWGISFVLYEMYEMSRSYARRIDD